MTLVTKSGRGSARLVSHTTVNNGQWHHVIAEADRKLRTFTLYVDGKPDSYGPGLGLTLRWRTTLICMSAARRAVIA